MKKPMAIVVVSSIVTFCVACTPHSSTPHTSTPDSSIADSVTEDAVVSQQSTPESLYGSWIVDLDGDVMLNPQTSGLKFSDGFLYSISDASADQSQTLRLHQISMDNSQVLNKFGPTTFSDKVKASCFYDYLSTQPDYEGLVPISGDKGSWIFVTEDASRNKQLSESCQQAFNNTGSTFYPSLIVRATVNGDDLQVTHVRPIQFPMSANVGDFPNDGIEGLTLTRDNKLLLGLEKDANGQARVFEIGLSNNFWDETGFVKVVDSKLLLPVFEQGNHPINGMDVVYPSADSTGFLLAAARNDNEMWVVDLAAKKPTKRIRLNFYAPSQQGEAENAASCEPYHLMNNASIEGVSVVEDEIWLVNDPWTINYHKNALCKADESRYLKMAPLLFKLPINDTWFE